MEHRLENKGLFIIDWKGAWEELQRYTLTDLCQWDDDWINAFCKEWNVTFPVVFDPDDPGTGLYYHVKREARANGFT